MHLDFRLGTAFAFLAVMVGSALVLANEPVDLIPRRVLFGNPDRVSPQISPDGSTLAFLAPLNDRMNVWVAPAGDVSQARAVTSDQKRGIRQYFWAHTNRHIIYLQDEGGDENWRVHATDITTAQTRDLTPFKNTAARIQELSPNCPTEILIALNRTNPKLHDLYRVDILSGEMRLVAENSAANSFVSFISDADYNVRFAVKIVPTGGEEILRPAAGGAWEPWLKISMEDAMATEPYGFDRAGEHLYLRDSRGRDTAALCSIDLRNDQVTVLAEDARADAATALIHPTKRTVQAVAFDYDRRSWKFIDPAVAKDFAALGKVAEGDLSIVSRSLDDQRWIVAFERDNGPTKYYQYDRSSGTAAFLFVNRTSIEQLALAPMNPVIIPSRDGMKLVSYLTLPASGGANETLKPAKPVPMVLLVHGGPWARDGWGFNATHQWLANRGYAVLSVNFRGSTGFGKNFTNAANREWAAKMHDDLLDAVKWAVDGGVADSSRIAIMGGSYGGYATLVGLTFTPDVFACGVDIVGPSNLVTLLESIPPYWEPIVESFVKRIGDHRTDAGRAFLMSRSPISFVDRIRRPLLIGQGANDPRVKQSESDQIVKAMTERKIPVTYVLYPDEGHGFQRPENRLSFNAVTEAFLGQHLGGRVEPLGEDLKGSSISVPAGAQDIPGMAAALER